MLFTSNDDHVPAACLAQGLNPRSISRTVKKSWKSTCWGPQFVRGPVVCQGDHQVGPGWSIDANCSSVLAGLLPRQQGIQTRMAVNQDWGCQCRPQHWAEGALKAVMIAGCLNGNMQSVNGKDNKFDVSRRPSNSSSISIKSSSESSHEHFIPESSSRYTHNHTKTCDHLSVIPCAFSYSSHWLACFWQGSGTVNSWWRPARAFLCCLTPTCPRWPPRTAPSPRGGGGKPSWRKRTARIAISPQGVVTSSFLDLLGLGYAHDLLQREGLYYTLQWTV